MQVLERSVLSDGITVRDLSARFADATPQEVLRVTIEHLFPERIALVSSFGADSVALLHMVGLIDRAVPVVFIDTGRLFPETIAYRDQLIEMLGLTNCRTFGPSSDDLALRDPEDFLWASDPESCCDIRKVKPLAQALHGFEAWISGRKRFQASTRAALSFFEADGGKTKVNPLMNWSAHDIRDYVQAYDLPVHPLVAKNFLSIGCLPCTSPVKPGEDPRAGRWRGTGKVECGIHTAPIPAGEGL